MKVARWAGGALVVLIACGGEQGGVVAGAGAGGAGATSATTGGGGQGGEPLPEPVPGLYAEYFAGYLDRALAGVEATVDVDWGDGGPTEVGSDRFSARYTGFVTAPESGGYTLIVDSDDGVRLWLDGVLVIDDWNGHFVTRNTAEVMLEANEPVAIELEYFEIDLAASLRLSWSSEAIAEEVIPTAHLSTHALPSGAAPKPPFTNPVIPFDCPDPGVVAAGDGDDHVTEIPHYVVCTGGSMPIRTSRGLVFWHDTGAQLLPGGKPAWAANGFRNWAPELHRVGDRFVGYYTSVNGANVLSIGATEATVDGAAGVVGPYADLGGPLVEHPDGVIDAHFFQDDDGSRWLTYKIDGNAHGKPTPIFIRELSPDGLSFQPGSSPTQILVNDATSWEGGVVEAQWLVRRGGSYYLFYSGNVYDHRYRTGVARSSSLLGPYEKHGPPILANNERWVGPGHGTVLRIGEADYFVYHAWTNAGNGTHLASAGRHVLVDRIDWVDGWPKIHDGTPSRAPQPWPGTTPR